MSAKKRNYQRYRKCSNCGFVKVPYYRHNGKAIRISYDKLICPKCKRHPSITLKGIN